MFLIVEELASLEPDSYITEVAEERVELDTVGWDITPDPEVYAPIADYLSAGLGKNNGSAPGRRPRARRRAALGPARSPYCRRRLQP